MSSSLGLPYSLNWTNCPIYNASGSLVADYTYDAWGRVLSVMNHTSACIGNLNPFRYRSYYYDVETGLYYLQTRYYNPEVRRFISPDGLDYLDPDTIQGMNLFAYCNNNPVNLADPKGHFAISLTIIGLIVGAIVGAAVGGTVAYNVAEDNGAEGWELFGWTVAGALGGGILGGALGAGVGALATQATGVLGFSVVKGNVFVVTKTMVLGHYGYAALGSSLGYGYYQISDKLWNSLTEIQRWAMNSQFLYDCYKLGANFIVEPTRTIAPVYNGNTSWLYYEIAFLIDKGYKWIEDLSALLKGGK